VPGFASGGIIPGLGTLSDIGHGIASAASTVGGAVVSGASDLIGLGAGLLKATSAVATGNPTALANAILGMFGQPSSGGLGGTVGKALLGMPATLTADVAKWIIGQPNTARQSASSSALHLTGSGGTIQALMQSMAASAGWTGAEWVALNNVENREAGYSLTATNPASGAYGLAQFINGPSEYAQYGGNSTTAVGQITAMLNYIKDRYGDPEAAWSHEMNYGWYDNGGMINEPILGYGVNSGRRYGFGGSGAEQVTPASELVRQANAQAATLAELRQQTQVLRQQVDAIRQIPAGVGDRVGGAINGAASSASFRNRYQQGGW
jgi:hypothetical protein